MIYLRVFMMVLAIYYIMLILQVITGVTWTAKKVTPLRFIIPFYFWFTINSDELKNAAIDTETEGMNPESTTDCKEGVYVKVNGKWVNEKDYSEIINKDE